MEEWSKADMSSPGCTDPTNPGHLRFLHQASNSEPAVMAQVFRRGFGRRPDNSDATSLGLGEVESE